MLLVDVNGVGYEMEAPMSTFYGLPAAERRWRCSRTWWCAKMRIFCTPSAPRGSGGCFAGCSKSQAWGRRIALGILSGASVDDFLRIIEAEDVAMLTRIPGIGRKTAERVIIEMRDSVKKLSMPAGGENSAAVGGAVTAQSEAFSALIALGYKPPEVTRLLKSVDEPGLSTTDIIRRALKSAVKA